MSVGDGFLGVIGASAVGWAAARPDGAPAVVEMLVDDRLVERALAKRSRPTESELATLIPAAETPAAAGPESGWYSLKAPPELRTGRPLTVEIRLEDGRVIGGGEFRLFGGLKAKFVTIDEGIAEGYVANPYADEAPASVDVRLDGALIGEAAIRPPGPDGRRRFRFPMPPELRDDKVHQVEVCWPGTTTELPGSPISWKAPKPAIRQLLRDREVAAGVSRSHPDYRLPAAERFGVETMLDDQAVRRVAPGAVAEHAARVWTTLASPPVTGGARLNIILTAGAFSDIEASFALGQLLQIDGAASVSVVLASEEAVRFAADDQRDSAHDGLVTPVAAARLMQRLSRLPSDDLVVFIPAHTLLTEAFLSALRAVIAGEADAAVGVCAKAAFVGDALLLATGAAEGWRSSREVVAVLRADALASRLRPRGFEFEGVRFDEVTLVTDMRHTAGVTYCAAMTSRAPVADMLLLFGGAATDPAPLIDLAPRRALATADAAPAPDGWTPFTPPADFVLEEAAPLARAIGGDADILALDAAVAIPPRDVLAACRAVATDIEGARLRHLPGLSPPKSVDDLTAAAEAALVTAAFGLFLSSSVRAL